MNWLFDLFAGIFQWPMRWFYELTGHNYLLALLLFTLLVKIVLIPLAVKQQKTQIRGAMLRPKMEIINKKYQGRNDRESLQQKQTEIMEMQQKEGYSPFSGCLPLLIQLPILLGIYQVVRKPFTYMLGVGNDIVAKLCEMVGVSTEEQLKLFDKLPGLLNENTTISGLTNGALTELPNMNAFGGAMNLAATPSIAVFNWLLLIPLLSCVFSYLSMKVSRKFNMPAQNAQPDSPEAAMSGKMLELTMPLMSIFIAFGVPAAVGVYWVFNSIFSIIQTIILAKLMPLPTFTEEQIRQYEKELKASHSRTSQGPRRAVRSRHHIDDDDYESLPEARSQKSAKAPKASGGIAPAPQKSDKNEDN